jgi:hypothetical protein
MRAVFERPNSTFLDMAIRYTSSNPESRLKQLKALEFGTRVTAETVFCYAKTLALFSFLAIALWLGVKYRIVAFPFLGIN